MKGYQINKFTDLKDLRSTLKSFPDPVPGEGEVLVDIYSAGLNFFDILMAAGKYQTKPPHPYVLGAEFAGVVSKDSPIPEGCSLRPGTRVFGHTQGAYAERAAVPYMSLMPIPNNLSFDEAAGMYLTYPTSYLALTTRGNLQPGEWLLVHAGAGGVGMAAILLGKLLGAKVIATAGSADKLEICKKIGGADYVVNYRDADWQDQIKRITRTGVDVVFDPVGLVQPSLKVVAHRARILIIGFAAGTIEKIPMNLVLLKNASLIGVFWGGYATKEPQQVLNVWEALLKLFGSGQLKPVVMDPVYEGLERVVDGLQDLQDRKTWGKAVVRIRTPLADSKL